MNEFRRLAAKIDQHMQQLAAQGVSEAHAIINRMLGVLCLFGCFSKGPGIGSRSGTGTIYGCQGPTS
jgi:hypothetical protein